jgi:hypothetical protein
LPRVTWLYNYIKKNCHVAFYFLFIFIIKKH